MPFDNALVRLFCSKNSVMNIPYLCDYFLTIPKGFPLLPVAYQLKSCKFAPKDDVGYV